MPINELRNKAAACRKRAAGKTGDAYHREMQNAQAFEQQAKEQEQSGSKQHNLAEG